MLDLHGFRGGLCWERLLVHGGGDKEAQPQLQGRVQAGDHPVNVVFGNISDVHVLDVVAGSSQGSLYNVM